jgi:hypothetical protein
MKLSTATYVFATILNPRRARSRRPGPTMFTGLGWLVFGALLTLLLVGVL